MLLRRRVRTSRRRAGREEKEKWNDALRRTDVGVQDVRWSTWKVEARARSAVMNMITLIEYHGNWASRPSGTANKLTLVGALGVPAGNKEDRQDERATSQEMSTGCEPREGTSCEKSPMLFGCNSVHTARK